MRRDALFLGLIVLAAVTAIAYLGVRGQALEASHDFRPRPDASFAAARAQLDAAFQEHWQAESLEPSPRAENLAICRRVSLALTGTIPSLEEIRQLEQIAPDQQISWWTSKLLADRRSADYLAERLARVYVGVEDGPFLIYRRRRFVSWLSDQLYGSTPYDELVTQLICGEGLWTDSPGVNFLTVTTDQNGESHPDPVRLAGRTARAFLGVRLDCVQCHDDNLGGDWLQSDFHELAAFYSEARSTFVGIRDKEHAYKTQYLHADQEEAIAPAFPFADDLLGNDSASSGETRRRRLAHWVTHPDNRAFGRAIVNRTWAWMFGKPLSWPVDDIPLSAPYPPGMELLADDFLTHDCDLKRLIRLIAESAPFQRASVADHELTTDHERAWAAFPLTRLRADQVAGSVLQAARLTTINAESHILVRLTRVGNLNDFVRRYGDLGEDEFSSDAGTIPQRLLMLNGQLIAESTTDDPIKNAAARITQLVKNNDAAIQAAYLTVLTRPPSDDESEHFVARLAAADSRTAAMQDLYWTLLNSTEFSWNH